LTVEVKVILGCFSHVSTQIRLEMNRERSELKKSRKISVWGINKS